MRVVVIRPGPAFSVQDVAQGWVDGLRAAGCAVVDYRLEERLTFYSNAHIKGVPAFSTEDAIRLAVKGVENVLYEVWPDLVVVISGFFLGPDLYELIRTRGHKVALIHTESPYQDDEQVARAGHVDLNIVNDPTNLARFRQANPASWYLPHAYDPARHHPRPGKDEHRSDFAFVGTGYPSRVAFFEQVDWTGVDAALAGNWQSLAAKSPLRKFLAHDIDKCCDNEEAVDLYVAAKASANLYRREAERPGLSAGWSMGPREVELAATGCFYLREPRPEGDELLPMLPTFTDPDDFTSKLRWWLDHDEQREQAARLALAAVAPRTFAHNAGELLRLLGT